MNVTTDLAQITLVVANPGQLMHGCKACHCFDRNGGTLGSLGSDWRLVDRGQRISPVHCEVRWKEGSFCIIDRSGETYMNDSDLSLTPGVHVRLQPDDRLQVGDYLITVHLDNAGTRVGDRHLSQHSLTELLNGNGCPLQALSRPISGHAIAPARNTTDSTVFDQLCAPLLRYDNPDPIEALDMALLPGQSGPAACDLFDDISLPRTFSLLQPQESP